MPRNLIDIKHQTFCLWQEACYITSWLIFIGKVCRLRRSQRNVLENWCSNLPNPHRVVAILLSLLGGSHSWPQTSCFNMEGRDVVPGLFNSQSVSHTSPSHWASPLLSLLLPSPHAPEQWRRGNCPAPQRRDILQPDGTKAWGGIYRQCGGSERASPEPPYLGQRLHWWVPPALLPLAMHTSLQKKNCRPTQEAEGQTGARISPTAEINFGTWGWTRCSAKHLPYPCKHRNPEN